MATSAQDRLARIFANNPLPPISQIGDKQNIQTISGERQEMQNSSQSSQKTAGIVFDHVSRQKTSKPIKFTTKSVTFTESEEGDDDYVSHFALRPKMKAVEQLHWAHNLDNEGHLDAPRDRLDAVLEGSAQHKVTTEKVVSQGEETTIDVDEVPEVDKFGCKIVAEYCQFSLLSKFPYKYMDDADGIVSRRFFADNKFYSRVWDIFYLFPPESLGSKALLFVPLSQAKDFLQEIGEAFEIQIYVPPFPFRLSFYDNGMPQPAFLGRSQDRFAYDEMIQGLSQPLSANIKQPKANTHLQKMLYDHYLQMLEASIQAVRQKKSKSKSKRPRHENRIGLYQETTGQSSRAERYLGLRRRVSIPKTADSNLSWENNKIWAVNELRACGYLMDPLDVHSPAPFAFDRQPVIICIDTETYERQHDLVTEIGISTLDTIDLLNVAPGPSAEHWIPHIRSRHFRIKGREGYVNKDFVAGRPNAFEFGRDEWIDPENIVEVVDSCFRWPYSRGFEQDGNVNVDTLTSTSKQRMAPEERDWILLGHDVVGDAASIRALGSQVFRKLSQAAKVQVQPSSVGVSSPHPKKAMMDDLPSHSGAVGDGVVTTAAAPPNIPCQVLSHAIEVLDTAVIHQAWKKKIQPSSLAVVCDDVGVTAWGWHNAGNDARYTLECFLKLALRTRAQHDADVAAADTHTNLIAAEQQARMQERSDQAIQLFRRRVEAMFGAVEEGRRVDFNSSVSAPADDAGTRGQTVSVEPDPAKAFHPTWMEARQDTGLDNAIQNSLQRTRKDSKPYDQLAITTKWPEVIPETARETDAVDGAEDSDDPY